MFFGLLFQLKLVLVSFDSKISKNLVYLLLVIKLCLVLINVHFLKSFRTYKFNKPNRYLEFLTKFIIFF